MRRNRSTKKKKKKAPEPMSVKRLRQRDPALSEFSNILVIGYRANKDREGNPLPDMPTLFHDFEAEVDAGAIADWASESIKRRQRR